MRTYRHRIVSLGIFAMLVVALLLGVVSPPPAAQAQTRLRVVASFSILADVAANVAGDAADVESLMAVGSNPHTFVPSAQDVVTLDDADVVFIVGANFEEGLLPVLQEAAGDRVVVASDCVPVRPVFAGTVHDEGEGAVDEPATPDADSALAVQCEAHHAAVETAFGLAPEEDDHHDTLGPLYAIDCGEHEGEEAIEGEHHHGTCDPHVWMDPVNAGLWTLAIRDTLSALDPANATLYAANADAYLAELAAMSAEVQAAVDAIPADRRYIVTDHLAFNYFAERYGLELVGVVIPGGSTTSEPSVQEVLDLIDTINAYQVPAIFTSETVNPDLAEQIAGETGVSIVSLYTGSLTGADGPASTYITYTLTNAARMAEALQ